MARNEAATLTIDLNLKGAGINRQIRDISKRMQQAFGKIETGGGGGGRGGQGVGGPMGRGGGIGGMLWNMFPVAYAASTAATLGNPMQSLAEKVANFPLVSQFLPLFQGGRDVMQEASAAGRTRGRVGSVVDMLSEGGRVSDEAMRRMVQTDKPLAERQADAAMRLSTIISDEYDETQGKVVEKLAEIGELIMESNHWLASLTKFSVMQVGGAPLLEAYDEGKRKRNQRAFEGE